jgi:2-polyprenyl-3-methyl-5-hydroxy-6-metoxy-1,4-benzoquinol methylase
MGILLDKNSCRYCGSAVRLCFTIRAEKYFRCSSCDLVSKQSDGRESREVKDRYYRSQYFSDYGHFGMSDNRKHIYRDLLEKIEKVTKRGKILDVGCGSGFFLFEARKRGWQVTGVDPSTQSAAAARQLLSGRVRHGGIADIHQHNIFDVVTYINTLEHVWEPWLDIKKVSMLLRPGGLLLLRFPNGKFHAFFLEILLKLHLETLASKFLVAHQHSFTPRFIQRFLSDFGYSEFTIRNVTCFGGDASATALRRGNGPDFVLKFLFAVLKLMFSSVPETLLISPSLEVTARKREA